MQRYWYDITIQTTKQLIEQLADSRISRTTNLKINSNATKQSSMLFGYSYIVTYPTQRHQLAYSCILSLAMGSLFHR